MSSREEVAKVIDLYIEGLNSENVGMIPLTGDVEFHGAICFDQGFSDTHRLFKGGS